MASGISVVIADRKRAARVSYFKQLQPEKGIRVVAEAGTSREVLRVLKLKPRVLLLDSKIAAMNETPLLPLLRRLSPQTKVILLTTGMHPLSMLVWLSQGAKGYLDRERVGASLPKAVRVVDEGEVWVSRAIVPLLITALSRMTLSSQGG